MSRLIADVSIISGPRGRGRNERTSQVQLESLNESPDSIWHRSLPTSDSTSERQDMKPHSPAVCEISILTYSVRIAAPLCTPWRAAKRVCRPCQLADNSLATVGGDGGGMGQGGANVEKKRDGRCGRHTQPPAGASRSASGRHRPDEEGSPAGVPRSDEADTTIPRYEPECTPDASLHSGGVATVRIPVLRPPTSVGPPYASLSSIPASLNFCAQRERARIQLVPASPSLVHNRSEGPGDRRPISRPPLRQRSLARPSSELQSTPRHV